MKTLFGLIEPPFGLVLGRNETIEWYVTFRVPGEFRDNSRIVHSNTSEGAERSVKSQFPTARILKVEYSGTYQY